MTSEVVLIVTQVIDIIANTKQYICVYGMGVNHRLTPAVQHHNHK